MSKKNTAPASATSTIPPTPDATTLTPAATTVLSLLNAHEATTAAELADRAGLGRSTVTKALATLHEAGLAARREGGHEGTRRIADQWFATPVAIVADADAQGDADADGHGDPATHVDARVERSSADAISDTVLDEPAEGVATLGLSAAETTDDGATDEPSPDQPEEVTDAAQTGADSDGESYDANPTDEATGHADVAVGGISDAERGTDPLPGADNDATLTSEATEKAKASEPRLGKGELRAQVEAYLSAHPDRSFTSTEIHHVLKRSSGAITNACDKLVAEKKAVITSGKPRRFQWNAATESETV
ncbi:MarR family transcriptional regulator [Catenulispora rubra]|uniref:MarR family transcriptional regulator n=1 Tax=Catenulispora rubra TaxID=280293 RepID=UPI001891FE8C|nr:helix-turn-helix domain-containing protein [Catenulispora rubra]